MGKMKQEFEKFYSENPDMSDAEYQDWLHSQGYKSVTQEEKQSQHDAWWDSLTEEQKQKLYEEVEAAEQDRIDNDMNGLNSQYGV